MRYVFLLFVFLHGLIHLMGFSKAFGYGQANQIGKEISKPAGLLWLAATLLFVTAAVLFWSRKSAWWTPAAAGVYRKRRRSIQRHTEFSPVGLG